MKLWDEDIEALRQEARSVTLELVPKMQHGMPVPTNLEAVDLVEAALVARQALLQPGSWRSDRAIERVMGGVPCRVLLPPGKPTAVVLQFHGGGLVVGGAEVNDHANEILVDQHGVAVISVRYRLAPEHPYPAAIEDAVNVARWLLGARASEFGNSQIVTAGRSAGAYLALMVLLRLRDEGADMRAFIGTHLVHGMHDWSSAPSHVGQRPIDLPDLIKPEEIAFFKACWLPGRSDAERRDPRVSTAWADLSGLPPALVAVATGDHLFDDSLTLASRWAAVGEIETFLAPDMPHGFTELPCAMTALWSKRNEAWWRRILA